MNKANLRTFAKEAAKGIKSQKDWTEFSPILKRITVEAALNLEMDAHPGYDKHQPSPTSNSRNGVKPTATLRSESLLRMVVSTWKRPGEFKPQLVKTSNSIYFNG